jgi:hypothetical protein
MNRILTTFSLLLCLLTVGPLVNGIHLTNETNEATKIKAEVFRRTEKKENRVKIKLQNGSEMKGRITQTAEDSFTLTDEKTGVRTDISYADVQKLEGRGMSKKTKVAIIAGAAVATFAAVFAYAFTHFWD